MNAARNCDHMLCCAQQKEDERTGDMWGRWRNVGGLCAAAMAAMSFLSSDLAAQGYPSGVVTLVVPYAAGTATDTFGRIFARSLESQLGQKFIVENRAGANGM